MSFANDLNKVWRNPKLSRFQKDQTFRKMQLAHTQEHSQAMVRRSKMQGFDQKYEAQHRLYTSDTIAHAGMISPNMLQPGGKLSQEAFKTTDQIMHERMSVRPFVPIDRFDVAAYVEYGRPKYDKHEDARMADGSVNKDIAKNLPTMGNKAVMGMDRKANKKRRQMQEASSGWGNNSTYAASSTSGGYGQMSGGNAYNTVRNY
jgi:hypothetical protein